MSPVPAVALHVARPAPVAGAIVLPLLRRASSALSRPFGPQRQRQHALARLQAFLLGWLPALRRALAEDGFVLPRVPDASTLRQRWVDAGAHPDGFDAIAPDPLAAALCSGRPAALGSLYAVQLWLADDSLPAGATGRLREFPGALPGDLDTRLKIKGTLARMAGLSPEEAAEAADSAARTWQYLQRRPVAGSLDRP
ncbi:hypothetical protein [Aquabacterium sp. J223]|uniref:hypothetical protein n=1 Tax=Aquabacterium sp. J223 TaxID=2898431 RepID=UPI0021AD6618|nr:hypothetical protein [Aquabacterium sp. J223]UUX97966.1 hypothetical protein LRS07_06270 [Aquabacterium sp. J223]